MRPAPSQRTRIWPSAARSRRLRGGTSSRGAGSRPRRARTEAAGRGTEDRHRPHRARTEAAGRGTEDRHRPHRARTEAVSQRVNRGERDE
eukprot:9650312-Alexandrium_andersonii.AAC.1